MSLLKSTNNSTKVPLLFVIALYSAFFYIVIKEADNIVFFDRYVHHLNEISILTSFICILNKKTKSFMYLSLLLITLSLSIYQNIFFDYRTISTVLLVFAAKDIDIDCLLNLIFKALTSTLLFMLFCVAIGTVNNATMQHEITISFFETDTAYNLGFIHYSGFSLKLMAVVYLFLLIKVRQFKWRYISIAIIVSLLGFRYCTTRLQIIICLYSILAYLSVAKYNLFNIDFSRKLFGIISLLAYPISFMFYYLLGIQSTLFSSDLFQMWDENFNNRMIQTLIAFSRYDITLLGQKIEMTGVREAQETGSEIFYIDAGYAYWLLALGVLMTLLLLSAYTHITYKAYKQGDKMLFLIMVGMSIANLINDFFINFFLGFPLLLLLFANYENRSK